ncbi:hypothetical protein ON010_g8643 [Phytophthora cinnamomi]|nr:hypothetical protein ON010_g8643 [Phytophthora cinnamomi]
MNGSDEMKKGSDPNPAKPGVLNISDEGESSDGETLSVGMTFDSGTDALHAVQDHALAHGKAVKLKQRSGVHRFIGCSSEGCELFVRVYRKRRADKTYGPWYISSMNTEHVSCVSSSNPTSRQIAELPTFESAVRADHTVSAPTLTQQIQSRDGISLQKKRRSLYRAKEAVKELGVTDLAQSYEEIPNYLSQFAALNFGRVAVVEEVEDGHFNRAIAIVKVFGNAVAARQSVVGVDCSHSKCPSYGGMQTHLVGRDGNLRNLTLPFGLVEAEVADNYSWFFSMLQQHGYDFTGAHVLWSQWSSDIRGAQDGTQSKILHPSYHPESSRSFSKVHTGTKTWFGPYKARRRKTST